MAQEDKGTLRPATRLNSFSFFLLIVLPLKCI